MNGITRQHMNTMIWFMKKKIARLEQIASKEAEYQAKILMFKLKELELIKRHTYG